MITLGFTRISAILLSLGYLQAAPINQDTLTAVEKEVVQVHDHVLPGLWESADRLVGGTHT